METTAEFSISVTGEQTGKPYNGSFTIKTILTRGERFVADQRRRELLGANAGEALPDLQLEAFYLGQLLVRIVKSPTWWSQSNAGQSLEDANVITELYDLCRKKEEEQRTLIKQQAEEALKQMAAKP